MATKASDIYNLTLPVGSIVPVLTSSAYSVQAVNPDAAGWLRCNGATIPAGHKLTGTVPDLTSSRFIRGSSTSHTSGGTNNKSICISAETVDIDHRHQEETISHDFSGTEHCHAAGGYYAYILSGSGCWYQYCVTGLCTPTGCWTYTHRICVTGYSRCCVTPSPSYVANYGSCMFGYTGGIYNSWITDHTHVVNASNSTVQCICDSTSRTMCSPNNGTTYHDVYYYAGGWTLSGTGQNAPSYFTVNYIIKVK